MLITADCLDKVIVKIADFGLARLCSKKNLATTIGGTPGYIAPEILEQRPYD